ncbi:hypothetical protein BBJ28_00004734 [Nothophytophthora sp. Chile5]|nr:hypothetical protein BBJ28_00004734 [Nothophytophthora sp. Chile5]
MVVEWHEVLGLEVAVTFTAEDAAAWRSFQAKAASPTFARQFAVYHHFRQLGWLLKPGLNYGAHYVLYRGSAAHFHSEYVVYVQDADEPLAWCTIQTLTRIAADVKKTVLVCDVTVASGSSPSLIGSAEGDAKSNESVSEEPGLTYGVYYFHGTQYTVEAVAIRFWDASLATGLSTESLLQPYAFQSQPVLLKKPKKPKKPKKRNQTKRPKGQQEAATAASSAPTKPSS